MEEDIDALRGRLLEQGRCCYYPSARSAIRDRYADTAYYIFKSNQTSYRGSFLSFGSRRSSVVSSYGNTPTVIRRSFSSSGMLEYSIEQVGLHKLKDTHVLPSITKEEKETDDQEGREATNVDTSTQTLNHEENQTREKRSDGIAPLQDVLPEEEDPYLSSKNRKIFHHYDMPPLRKQSLQRKMEERIVESPHNGAPGDDGNADGPLQSEVETKNVNLTKSVGGSETTDSKAGFDPNEPQPLQTPQKLESSPILPQISAIPQQESSVILLKRSSSNETSFKEDKDGILSLPLTSQTSQLGRAGSVNEKSAANPFPRKSVNRFSLRDLPLRSPTPPKRSPRKTSKNANKEREATKGTSSSPPTSQKEGSPALTASLTQSVSTQNSFPPLISPTNIPTQSSDQLLQSLVSSKPPPSVQKLDETPLFIVEDEDYDKPSTVSPRVGIHNLVSDGKLSKSFIVVHPTKESNSLGLAPLSASTAAASLKKKAVVKSESRTTAHSTSTTPDSESPNGPKTFLLYPNQSSSSRSKSMRGRSDSDVGSHVSNVSANNSHNGSSGSFLSTKRPSQIRLLRFTKSSEEGLSPCIPSMTKTSHFIANYHPTKAQIRSFSHDTSYEKVLSLDLSENFVNTNSSRLCSVM